VAIFIFFCLAKKRFEQTTNKTLFFLKLQKINAVEAMPHRHIKKGKIQG